jgi:hypothetical protein
LLGEIRSGHDSVWVIRLGHVLEVQRSKVI